MSLNKSHSDRAVNFIFFRYAVINILFLLCLNGNAQQTFISGRVIDATTRDPIPFCNIYFNSTKEGTITDFDGYYKLESNQTADSLTASFIGYKRESFPLIANENQRINITLLSSTINLQEIVFHAEENPAFAIMRQVINNKRKHDKRELDYYEYESYNRTEIAIYNISDKLKKNKTVANVLQTLDSIKVITDEEGRRILPLFVSENLSDYYIKTNPEYRKEIIKKSRITGVGLEDGEFMSQLLGSSFREYNFYKNWINIINKEFVSPLTDGWKLYYDYYLIDSLNIDGQLCYQLSIFPKNSEDLAFAGSMWITKENYALKQIDLTISQVSNLNFIESLKIQQVLKPTTAGQWLPSKTRVIIDVGELSKKFAGTIIKFYNSNNNWIIDNPRKVKFYKPSVEVREDFMELDPIYWDHHRHDSLSEDDKILFPMVDTLRSIQRIKNYGSIVKIFVTGYYRNGKIDIGPLLYTYSYNNIEGNRLRIGLRTNEFFNNKLTFRGYLAYGFNDKRIKYGLFAHYVIRKKPWIEIIYGSRYDIDQVGLQPAILNDYVFFSAITRFGTLKQPYVNNVNAMRFKADLGKGFSSEITLRRTYFNPLYSFAYYKNLDPNSNEILSDFIDTSLSFEIRYARDETFLINGNQRVSTGIRRAPAINIKYTHGFDDFLGGDFTYHKLSFKFQHRFKLGFVGVSNYAISAGKVFNPLPYPLLFVHIGNETIFYSTVSYNMMNYFEFVSDRFISLKYDHHFEGFILNRVPLLSKLKWRMIGNVNTIWGDVNPVNHSIIPEYDEMGNLIDNFGSLQNKPYIEIGYGIENIFKVFRLQFFHRLNYLENPAIKPFGIKIGFQFIF